MKSSYEDGTGNHLHSKDFLRYGQKINPIGQEIGLLLRRSLHSRYLRNYIYVIC